VLNGDPPVERDRVFVSYRRTDAAGDAGRLREALVGAFGEQRVFQDLSIRPGEVFPDKLQIELDRAAVLLVVISTGWLAASDEYYRRRIDLPDDWVRREIRSGLQAGIPVIPVLLDQATLPPAPALPADLASLGDRQWHRIHTETWAADLAALVSSISSETGWLPPRSSNASTGQQGARTRVFGTRPPVVRDFVDREESNLIAGPADGRAIALRGIGGVGKSQLAARYFRDHQTAFDYAAWINMADQGGRTDYAAIANALELDLAGRELARVVRNTIEGGNHTWLMVFDNVAQPGQVLDLLPQAAHVKVLITSRFRGWEAFCDVVDVGVFAPDVAARYILDRTNRTADPDVDLLAGALGYLPLGLSLAAALCFEQALPFASFLERTAASGLRSSLGPAQPTTYDRQIEALWRESLDVVAEQDGFAAELLEVLSLLEWTVIERRWLCESGLASPDAIDQALARLASHSLVELTDKTVAIKHNLIARGLAEAVRPEVVQPHLEALFSGAIPEPSPLLDAVQATGEYVRHLRRLLNDHRRLIDEPLIEPLLAAAGQLNLQGAKTPTFHEALLDHCQELFGPDDPRTLEALVCWGGYLTQAGRWSEALVVEEQVLADSERVLGPDDPDTSTARSNLAEGLRAAGRVEEAAALDRRVLADSERVLGVDHPDTLTSRSNLAADYRLAGQFDKAVELDEQVLRDRERVLGSTHPATLRSGNNLAAGLRLAGRLRDAVALDERVFRDRERVLGPDHPSTLNSLESLAKGLRLVGRFDEALVFGEELLRRSERVFGPDHSRSTERRAALADWSTGRDGRNPPRIES
jgi:tetratricopeptide (TPR) repeat protein